MKDKVLVDQPGPARDKLNSCFIEKARNICGNVVCSRKSCEVTSLQRRKGGQEREILIFTW